LSNRWLGSTTISYGERYGGGEGGRGARYMSDRNSIGWQTTKKKKRVSMRDSEFLIIMNVKITIFCDVTSCNFSGYVPILQRKLLPPSSGLYHATKWASQRL
jgi:hypothetical protein